MEKGEQGLEFCGHSGCIGGRAEYCGVEAANPIVDAAIVSDALKSVLYEENNNQKIKRDGYYDQEGSMTNAIFLETQPSEEPGIYDPVSRLVAASHTVDHIHSAEKFGLESSWHVPDNEMEIGWIATKYLVSMSPKGEITAMVAQMNIETGELETNKMTHYDWLEMAEHIKLLDKDSDVLDIGNDWT